MMSTNGMLDAYSHQKVAMGHHHQHHERSHDASVSTSSDTFSSGSTSNINNASAGTSISSPSDPSFSSSRLLQFHTEPSEFSAFAKSPFGRFWRLCTLNFLCEVLVADSDEAGGDRLKQMYELLGLISALLVGVAIGPVIDMHNWLVPKDQPTLSESRPVAIVAVVSIFGVLGFSIFNIIYVTVITIYLNVITADQLHTEVVNLPVWGIPLLVFIGTILSAFLWICSFLFIQFPFYALPICLWFGIVLAVFFSGQFYLFVFRLPRKMEEQVVRKKTMKGRHPNHRLNDNSTKIDGTNSDLVTNPLAVSPTTDEKDARCSTSISTPSSGNRMATTPSTMVIGFISNRKGDTSTPSGSSGEL